MRQTISLALLTWTISLFTSSSTLADIIIDVRELSGNVVATLGGSLNLDAVTVSSANEGSYEGFDPVFGAIGFLDGEADEYDVNTRCVGFGPGGFGRWDAIDGDVFAMWRYNTDDPIALLTVPTGYVSGDVLSGVAIKFDTDLETLGMTPGTYVNTFSNDGVTDTLSIIVSVPEPSTTLAFLLLSVVPVCSRRRKVVSAS